MLKTLPIILTLCLMLSGAYYVKNYAGIIGLGLLWTDSSILHHITAFIVEFPSYGLTIPRCCFVIFPSYQLYY